MVLMDTVNKSCKFIYTVTKSKLNCDQPRWFSRVCDLNHERQTNTPRSAEQQTCCPLCAPVIRRAYFGADKPQYNWFKTVGSNSWLVYRLKLNGFGFIFFSNQVEVQRSKPRLSGFWFTFCDPLGLPLCSLRNCGIEVLHPDWWNSKPVFVKHIPSWVSLPSSYFTNVVMNHGF